MAPNQSTGNQVFDLMEFFGKQKLSREQFQNVLENKGLLKQMFACPDLSMIDKQAFEELLKPKTLRITFPWTAKDEFVSKIMDRSNLRGWGFTLADAKKLLKKLTKHDHAGNLQPTSVKMWLGGDLAFNYSEILLWVKDEVEKLGKRFVEYDDYVNRLSFLSGSEITGEKFLDVCDLDLQMFWDNINGIVFGDIKSNCKTWPSLEVLILLALNPQVYIIMDGKTVPYLIAPGFVVGSGSLLLCSFDGGEACVYGGYWDDHRWCSCAFVAFRES